LYLKEKKYSEAIAQFEHCVKLDSGFAEAYYNLGFVLAAQEKYQESLAATKRAMELKSRYTGGSFKLGIDFYVDDPELLILSNWQGSGQEQGTTVAGDVFGGVLEEASIRSKSAKFDELSLESDVEKLKKLVMEGKKGEAKKKARVILEQQPQNILALEILARIALEENQGAEAIFRYQTLVKLSPGKKEFKIGLAKAYLVEGNNEKGIALLKKEISNFPDDPDLQYALGLIYLSNGNYQEAKICYENALKTNPSDSFLYLGLGDISLAQNEPEEAIMAYRQAIKLNHKMFHGYYKLAKLYVGQNKLELAIEELKKAVVNNPAHLESHLALGDAYMKLGMLEKASVEYAVAAKILPECFDAKLGLALLATKSGQIDKAIQLCQGLMKSHDNNAELLLLWGRLQANRGNSKEAVASWKRVITLSNDEKIKTEADKAIKAALQWQEISGSR